MLARFGGEEFTILCRGSDLSGAKIVAERVRKAVEERKFSFGGKDIPVTVSLGVVAIPESGITEHNAFLAAADKALYEAKRSGRNRVCVHGSREDAQRAAQALQLGHRLDRAADLRSDREAGGPARRASRRSG